MTHSKASDVLEQLMVNAGEEYHKLHSDKQSFSLTDGRMGYYGNQAARQLYQDILGLIGEDAYWYVDEDGNKQTNQFNDTVNGERRRLRTALATYFGQGEV